MHLMAHTHQHGQILFKYEHISSTPHGTPTPFFWLGLNSMFGNACVNKCPWSFTIVFTIINMAFNTHAWAMQSHHLSLLWVFHVFLQGRLGSLRVCSCWPYSFVLTLQPHPFSITQIPFCLPLFLFMPKTLSP